MELSVVTSKPLLLFLSILIIYGCDSDDRSPETAETEMTSVHSDMNSGFEAIFNGVDLSGWEGDSRFWSVEEGRIIGETTEENAAESNTFLIWQEGEPDNFEIRFDYRFVTTEGDAYGNSGIQVRSERFADEENPDQQYRVRGYQADFAISDWISGILYEERGREVLARRGQKVLIDSGGEQHPERVADEDDLGAYIHHTEWNEYHVYALGDTIRSSLNGRFMHELVDQSPEARSDGILAFQLHSGPPMRVEIRNVELRPLD